MVRKQTGFALGNLKKTNDWISSWWNPSFSILKKDSNITYNNSLGFSRHVGRECTEIVFKVSEFSFRSLLCSLSYALLWCSPFVKVFFPPEKGSWSGETTLPAELSLRQHSLPAAFVVRFKGISEHRELHSGRSLFSFVIWNNPQLKNKGLFPTTHTTGSSAYLILAGEPSLKYHKNGKRATHLTWFIIIQ